MRKREPLIGQAWGQPRRAAGLWALLVAGLGLAPGLGAGPRVAHATQELEGLGEGRGVVAQAIRTLQSAPDAPSRARAAAALGRVGDRQAVPALIQAMIEDQAAPVRGACAEVLGRLADPASRAALRAALQDSDAVVRDKAQRALGQLAPSGQLPVASAAPPAPPPAAASAALTKGPPMQVALGRMGSKARAPRELVQRLHDALEHELQATPGVRVVGEAAGDGYTVDSSITELTRRTAPSGEVEVNCEISLVIGVLPSHAIVGVTSGGATVSSPRRSKPTRAAVQELEQNAVNHAVHGAHQNLVAFLRSRR